MKRVRFISLVFLIVLLVNQLTILQFGFPQIAFADGVNKPNTHVFSNPRIANKTYYATSYNVVGSTTFVSGSIADLKIDDGAYMTFRSYATANGTGSLGSSVASTTGSTTIESQIVGSLFTPSSSGWLTNIMAYVGVTTTVKLGGAALYRHSDLAWIANTSVVSLAIATSWRTFTFAQPYPAVISGTEYILVVWSASGNGNGLLYYGDGAANQGHIDPQTWGAWPKPLVPTTHNAFVYDINASMIVPSEYTCDVEFVGTSDLEDWVSLFWAVNSRFTASDVITTIQLYNHVAGNYPANGDGFVTYNVGTINQPKNQTILAAPTAFRNSVDSVWKLKIKGVKATNLSFDFLIDFLDPTVIFTTVSVTSVHTCPLDTHTFVIAYHDETNDDFSFQIWDTNGTQVLAETDVDQTAGSAAYTCIGVSAFNSTTFVVGWYDLPDADVTFAVYNTTGALLSGPTDADDDAGFSCYSVQVSCFNSTYFVIGWYDRTSSDATFAVYDSSSTSITGQIDVDTNAGSYCYSVSVSTFNSTHFVIGWYDDASADASFSICDSAGTILNAAIDADTDCGLSSSVSVSTLNSTHFVIGWYDKTGDAITFAVYSAATLKTGPTVVDATAGVSQSVQVSALNSTAFIISWYDATDFDLSFATYLSDGTVVAALTDIESWPTTINAPFKYQSPCSQETGTGIELYGDNWIIAYANTTTQAIWKAFTPAGAAWDGTIPSAGEEYSRSASQTITLSLVASKLFEITRPVTQAISIALSGTRLFDITRMVTQGISFNLATSRIANFIRVATQAITTSFQTSRLGEWFRSVSQSITAALTATRLIDITRTTGLLLGISVITLRLAQFARASSQTFSFEFTTTGIANFVRSASQAITTILNGSRLAEWIKAANQTISVTLVNTRLAQFVRSASQSIVLSLEGVGEKIGIYLRNVLLTITATLNTNRLTEATRQATQTLSLSLSTSRVAQFVAIAVLTITTAFNADHLIDMFRSASQSLNFLLNGERLIEVSRSVSQTIALTFETLGEMVGNYFRTALLNVGFTFATLAEVPAATILLALAIALIVVACVVTYAVAKTQTTEKD